MDVDEVAPANLVSELGQRLNERHALDVAHRSTLDCILGGVPTSTHR
jgi:hypothetical protein